MTDNKECNLAKEFDDFITDCANCSDCETEFFCPEHSSEWGQVYKHHFSILKHMVVKE